MVLVLLPVLATTPGPAQAQGQGTSRTFPETGKTVQGRFLQYWNANGGLPQQGYPISNEMQEVSETDGRTYTVQYFERAVFEAHPENRPPYDVLLSLLGTFLYKQKYGGNAPGQAANNAPGSRFFPETGKRVGGIFLDYWTRNGGLAQQGYPISDEFQEVSDLDGKTYRVQYFERAVFEQHPENAPPYNVLLSQLGKFRYLAKYSAGGQPPPPPGPNPPPPGPNPPPPAPPPSAGCDPSGSRDGRADPTSVRAGGSVVFYVWGMLPGEAVSFWFTLPSGDVVGTARPVQGAVEGDGTLPPLEFTTTPDFAQAPGKWAITFEGASSHHQSIIYFCITR
jgi:hypothetical protein